MVDPISVIRQLMAESKFYEAQIKTELYLSSPDETSRAMLLPLYLELLEIQGKQLPLALILETAELWIENDSGLTDRWMDKLGKSIHPQHYLRLSLLKIKLAEKKGRLDELYQLISHLRVFQFEKRMPASIDIIDVFIQKYFKHDFRLKLQELAITLMLCDISKAEAQVANLISSCVERASPKSIREKLLAIAEIINIQKEKKQLEIYQNYSRLRANGIKEKNDYKRLVEMIIYFDDFKFQILILDLLESAGLHALSADYARDIRLNPVYDFVYIEKYFIHLKKFFSSSKVPDEKKPADTITADYQLDGPLEELEKECFIPDQLHEEESLIIGSLKFQSYTSAELIELSVSFLQARFPRACSEAAGLAMKGANDNVEYLKACYLKAISLFQLADYRSVLDFSMEAMGRAESEEDILSFLYLQAEAYLQMEYKMEARDVLLRILSIDEKYRLARERLQRLDEI